LKGATASTSAWRQAESCLGERTFRECSFVSRHREPTGDNVALKSYGLKDPRTPVTGGADWSLRRHKFPLKDAKGGRGWQNVPGNPGESLRALDGGRAENSTFHTNCFGRADIVCFD